MSRPLEVCMELVDTGSILIELEVGEFTGQWVQVAPAYTVASSAHRVLVDRTSRRLRITPSGGARYSASDSPEAPPEPLSLLSFDSFEFETSDGLIIQVIPE